MMQRIFIIWLMAMGIEANSQPVKKESLLPVEPKQMCNIKKQDTPDPFSPYNRFAELSPGELYSLHGKILKGGFQYYFQVNLNMHPWLASKIRTDLPYYFIENNGMAIEPYVGRMVQLNFVAQQREMQLNGKSFMTIKLLEAPSLISVCRSEIL